jgi:hypothetical protein
MRILVDENIDVKVIRLFRKLGHDVKRVPAGFKNGDVMRLAIHEGRVIVTRDADFTDPVRFPISHTPGIIHVDIHPPRYTTMASSLSSFLKSVSGKNLVGRLFVISETGYAEFT